MRRLVPALIAAAAVVLAAAPTVAAHELQVAPPGPVELDLGLLSRELLIHTTLQAPADTAQLTFRVPDGEQWSVEAFLPDARPERDASPTDLPELLVDTRASTRSTPLEADERVRDEVTGVRYLAAVAREAPLALQSGAEHDVLVGCDQDAHPDCLAETMRVAIRIARDDGMRFAAQDVERTRRTVARTVAWASAGATSDDRSSTEQAGDRRRVAWFGAAIALMAILLAAWWVHAGRRRARERGAERDLRDRSDA